MFAHRRGVVAAAATATAALAVLAGSPTAYALPEDPGLLVPLQWNAGMAPAGGTSVPVLVYYPTGAPGSFPVVEIVHGFARNGSFHTVLGDTLASRGLVVVVPDMPCGLAGCDYELEATAVSDLLDWIEAQGADASSPDRAAVPIFRRYAVAWTTCLLGVDPTMGAWVGARTYCWFCVKPSAMS